MTSSGNADLATAADLAALSDDVRAEVVGGQVAVKAAPSAEHGDAQFALATFLRSRFHGGGGGGRQGGWWILGEVEVEFEAETLPADDESLV